MSDSQLIKHPEFELGIDIAGNVVSWTSFGYAISEKLFKDKIYRIQVKFTQVPGVAWIGILKCDEKFANGNVYLRENLCVFQSNGFGDQSGFSYGNEKYEEGEIVSLEINLTSPSSSALNDIKKDTGKEIGVSDGKAQVIDNLSSAKIESTKESTHSAIKAVEDLSAEKIKSTDPEALSPEVTSEKPTSPRTPSSPKPPSSPQESPKPKSTSPVLSSTEEYPYVFPSPSLPSSSLTSPSSLSSSPSLSSSSSSSSTSSSSSSDYVFPPCDDDSLSSSSGSKPAAQAQAEPKGFTTEDAARTGNTLHFYVNDRLQPVSYVHVPTPLRFIVYCNYGDSQCEVLDVKEISPEESTFYKLQHGSIKAVDVSDPDEKGYTARIVEWNTTPKRNDR